MFPTFDTLESRWLLSRGPIPLAPSALKVQSATSGAVTLTFGDNSKNETGFVIERSTAGGAFAAVGTLPGSPGRGGRVFGDTTVSSGVRYQYRVRAVIGGRSSFFAGPVAAKTVKAGQRPPELPRHLLFFGNSFTLYNGLATLVADIASADGHAVPDIHVQANNGWTLAQHLDKVAADGAANVVDSSLPAGSHWDDVVLQALSVEPTDAASIGGNVAAFLSAAKGLFGRVRAGSPQVHGVLFETWARGADSPFYPGTFANPAAMQDQLQANYAAADAGLESIGGPGSAEVAPVGEVWRAQHWDRNLYDSSDEYHPSPRGSLFAALTLYATIYHDGVSNIPAAKVGGDLARLGLDAADWASSTAAVDRLRA